VRVLFVYKPSVNVLIVFFSIFFLFLSSDGESDWSALRRRRPRRQLAQRARHADATLPGDHLHPPYLPVRSVHLGACIRGGPGEILRRQNKQPLARTPTPVKQSPRPQYFNSPPSSICPFALCISALAFAAVPVRLQQTAAVLTRPETPLTAGLVFPTRSVVTNCKNEGGHISDNGRIPSPLQMATALALAPTARKQHYRGYRNHASKTKPPSLNPTLHPPPSESAPSLCASRRLFSPRSR